jgi:DUF1009 family protein
MNGRARVRTGIIAGGGSLPLELAKRLSSDGGQPPFVIRMIGEAGPEMQAFDGVDMALENLAHSLAAFRKAGVSRVVFAGAVGRRPRISALRIPFSLWPHLPGVALKLKRGDNDLLSHLVSKIEAQGISIIGAHHILPDHVVPEGRAGQSSPPVAAAGDLRHVVEACLAIGRLDIGQGVVAIGRRIVAVEGAEGTDAMLHRVAALRESGRLPADAPAILVKLAKPGQELRVDMPTIGPVTVESALKAGVAALYVSAESTLMMQAAETLAKADAAGIAIVGIRPEQAA